MTELFITVLNMSITASYIALAVIAIRLLFRKAPKIFSYVLWLAVLIRLICPFSFSSSFSLLGFIKPVVQTHTGTMEYVPSNIGSMPNPSVDVGTDMINHAANTSLPPATPMASVNPMQILMEIAGIIWVAGIVILLIYCAVSYFKLINRVKTAILVKDNIFETDRINTPFLCGFIKPKIYIPVGMSHNELSYIFEHEQTHIQRLDYLVKPFAFLVLVVHWFNPLMWLSFSLMSKDMEMSCDESVIKKMGNEVKGSYSNSLLNLSVKRSGLILGSPLAFGESNIKSRIKNVLNYKKPAFWVIILAIAATASLIVAFTANPKHEQTAPGTYSGLTIETLLLNKTSYVGNNSKVVALIDTLPLPEGIVRNSVKLQTSDKPYGIKILFDMNKASDIMVDGAISSYAFYRNSILLFSLIDNVDVINCNITNKAGKYNGAIYDFTFTREEVEKLIGEDVRHYSENADTIKSLIDKMINISIDATAAAQQEENARIEKYLETIVSSPKESSNHNDYIKAHRTEYESILKMGDGALNYLLKQFEKSGSNDLKGYIIMVLCKDLLGDRNNVTDDSLPPQDWFAKLSPYKEIELPDFRFQPDYIKNPDEDWITQLVYNASVKQYSRPGDGFTVIAPTIFGKYENGNTLKIFATVFSNRYKLYNKTLSEVGGSVVPAAITFIRDGNGVYNLKEYRECKDGSYFSKSIADFCTLPVTGKVIEGLHSKIMKDYGNNKDRDALLIKNLKEHLKTYVQTGVSLKAKGQDAEPTPLT